MKAALDLRAVATLVVLCASWGLNQVAIKAALAGIPPFLQMGGRSAVATVLVALWCVVRRVPVFRADGTLLPGLAAGLLFSAEFVVLYLGLQFTTASRGIVILYGAPFVVAGVGHFALGERLGAMKLAGLLCAFSGIVLTFADSLLLGGRGTLIGDALCLAAACLWGLLIVVTKGSALSEVAAEKSLLYQLATSALVGLVLAAVFGERVDPGAAVAVLPAFLYQAVWVAGVTYVAWLMLIRVYPASLLSSFTFLAPLFGVAFGALLLHDEVSRHLLSALGLVGVGLYLVNRPSTSPPPHPA